MKLKGLGQRLYNIFFDTHTVAGIVISAGLFVIFYAGAFSLFRYEISRWENPELREVLPAEMEAERSMEAILAAVPKLDGTKQLTIRPGNEANPLARVFGSRMVTDSTSERFTATIDVANDYKFTFTGEAGTTIGTTLYYLHYFRHIPFIGTFLSGFVALFFLFATVTGVIIHWRNIVTKFYAFRPRAKWKQIWTNSHTVLGVIGLPFQIVYAVTGAFYGILIILLIPSALILFGGDQTKVIAAVSPAFGIEVSDTAAILEYTNVNDLVATGQARYPTMHLSNMRFLNYGREDGTLELYYDDERTMNGQAQMIYRVHTEELVFEEGPKNPNYASSVISTMGRLHFASFGGIGVKVIYFILAMLTCFMIISGVLLWQVARDKKSYTDKEKRFHHRVTKWNLAICLGLFPAIAVLFLANKFIPLSLEGRTFYVELVFFVSWLVLILVGLRWNNYRRLNYNYLLVGGVLSLLVPVANGLMTGDWLWSSLAKRWFYVAAVDLFWLFAGLTSLAVCMIIKRQEKVSVGNSRQVEKTAPELATV